MPRLKTHHGFPSPQAKGVNIPGRKNVPKTAKHSVTSSRILAMAGGTRLSARIATVMIDSARSVRMSRWATPCKGSEVIDTTMEGIDNARVAMRNPSIRLSGAAVEVFCSKSARVGSSIGSTHRSAR